MNRSFERPMCYEGRMTETKRYRTECSDSPQRMYWRQLSYWPSLCHSQMQTHRRSSSWMNPKPRMPPSLYTLRKADIEKDNRRSHAKKATQSMFRHFKYPEKVPAIPDKIHKGHLRRGKVNSAVNDAEMLPSYTSHKQNRLPSPSSYSSSEEEYLYQAEDDNSVVFSEHSSFDDAEAIPDSDGEPDCFTPTPQPPYHIVEEEHYKEQESFRSDRGERESEKPQSRASNPSDDPPRSRDKPKPHRRKHPTSDYNLSPLREEETQEKKKPHKAQMPRSMPEPKTRPPPLQQTQFVPQPILYPMPQPFPMPIPVFQPQYYYPGQPGMEMERERRTEPSPLRTTNTRESSTQCCDLTPTVPSFPTIQATQTTESTIQSFRSTAFIEALAEIDRKLCPPLSLPSPSPQYPKSVALEIGVAERKSLAERFQEKLPEVQAKMVTRSSEKGHLEHKDKSTTELLEIRKELLRPPSATPRNSNADLTGERRRDSPNVRKIDPRQLERADRLAAGKSAVEVKKPIFSASSSTPDRSLSRIDEETKSVSSSNNSERLSQRPVKMQ